MVTSPVISQSVSNQRNDRKNEGILGRYDVDYDGDIEFTADDRSVKAISRGGYLRIKSISFGNKREVLIEPGYNGEMNYEYYLGKNRVHFTREGRNWLKDILIDVIRISGVGAEKRTQRIYNTGGTDAVLTEISKIDSDYVGHLYLIELLQKDLSTNDLIKVAQYIPEGIKSDLYVLEVFKNSGSTLLRDQRTAQLFISASLRSIKSDLYLSNIVSRAIKRSKDQAIYATVLNGMKVVRSEFYRTEILKSLFDEELDKGLLVTALKSVNNINADVYKYELLKSGCYQVQGADDEVRSLFSQAAKEINSDSYYGAVARCIYGVSPNR